MFGRIHRVSHLGLKFLCWKHLATNSIFSMERELFRLFILNEFCIFQIIASFQLRFQNYGYKVVITFPYYPSTICGICSDVLPFTPDIDHLGCLFFLNSVARSSSILLIFLRTRVWSHWCFLLVFSFQFHWFLLLSLLFPSFCFGSICSFFFPLIS